MGLGVGFGMGLGRGRGAVRTCLVASVQDLDTWGPRRTVYGKSIERDCGAP